MTDYLVPGWPVDRAALKQQMIDDLTTRLPGVIVDPGTFFDVLLDGAASFYAQLGEQATERDDGVFRRYGDTVLRVQPLAATSASGTITVKASLTTGGTLLLGTEISLDDGDDRQLFQVTQETTIAANATAAGIPIVAVTAGTAGTGLSADPQLEVAGDTVDWIDTITVDAPTTGGDDGEDDDEYLTRLADELPLQAITIVRAVDAARLARNTPGIGAALALDLYDASTSTANVGGHLTVAVRSDTGTAVSGPIKTALAASIAERSVAGLTTHVIDATYTTVTIVFAGKSLPGYDPAAVEVEAEGAVARLISPAIWGSPGGSGTLGDSSQWTQTAILRRQDVITALNNTDGFDYFTTLTINGSSTADLTLTGAASLPAPLPTSSVAGTVTA